MVQLSQVRDRYSDPKKNVYSPANLNTLLPSILQPSEIQDSTILEFGAGNSSFVQYCLNNNCSKFIANDIVPERLSLLPFDDRIDRLLRFLDINYSERLILCSFTFHDVCLRYA